MDDVSVSRYRNMNPMGREKKGSVEACRVGKHENPCPKEEKLSLFPFHGASPESEEEISHQQKEKKKKQEEKKEKEYADKLLAAFRKIFN